jgi:hypothetical protein
MKQNVIVLQSQVGEIELLVGNMVSNPLVLDARHLSRKIMDNTAPRILQL